MTNNVEMTWAGSVVIVLRSLSPCSANTIIILMDATFLVQESLATILPLAYTVTLRPLWGQRRIRLYRMDHKNASTRIT
jgi:hypothetical protein